MEDGTLQAFDVCTAKLDSALDLSILYLFFVNASLVWGNPRVTRRMYHCYSFRPIQIGFGVLFCVYIRL